MASRDSIASISRPVSPKNLLRNSFRVNTEQVPKLHNIDDVDGRIRDWVKKLRGRGSSEPPSQRRNSCDVTKNFKLSSIPFSLSGGMMAPAHFNAVTSRGLSTLPPMFTLGNNLARTQPACVTDGGQPTFMTTRRPMLEPQVNNRLDSASRQWNRRNHGFVTMRSNSTQSYNRHPSMIGRSYINSKSINPLEYHMHSVPSNSVTLQRFPSEYQSASSYTTPASEKCLETHVRRPSNGFIYSESSVQKVMPLANTADNSYLQRNDQLRNTNWNTSKNGLIKEQPAALPIKSTHLNPGVVLENNKPLLNKISDVRHSPTVSTRSSLIKRRNVTSILPERAHNVNGNSPLARFVNRPQSTQNRAETTLNHSNKTQQSTRNLTETRAAPNRLWVPPKTSNTVKTRTVHSTVKDKKASELRKSRITTEVQGTKVEKKNSRSESKTSPTLHPSHKVTLSSNTSKEKVDDGSRKKKIQVKTKSTSPTTTSTSQKGSKPKRSNMSHHATKTISTQKQQATSKISKTTPESPAVAADIFPTVKSQERVEEEESENLRIVSDTEPVCTPIPDSAESTIYAVASPSTSPQIHEATEKVNGKIASDPTIAENAEVGISEQISNNDHDENFLKLKCTTINGVKNVKEYDLMLSPSKSTRIEERIFKRDPAENQNSSCLMAPSANGKNLIQYLQEMLRDQRIPSSRAHPTGSLRFSEFCQDVWQEKHATFISEAKRNYERAKRGLPNGWNLMQFLNHNLFKAYPSLVDDSIDMNE